MRRRMIILYINNIMIMIIRIIKDEGDDGVSVLCSISWIFFCYYYYYYVLWMVLSPLMMMIYWHWQDD